MSTALPARACNTRSSLGLNSCWPHSHALVECLFLLLPPFYVSQGAVQQSIKMITPLVRYSSIHVWRFTVPVLRIFALMSCSRIFINQLSKIFRDFFHALRNYVLIRLVWHFFQLFKNSTVQQNRLGIRGKYLIFGEYAESIVCISCSENTRKVFKHIWRIRQKVT